MGADGGLVGINDSRPDSYRWSPFPRGGPVQDRVATMRALSGAQPTVGIAVGFTVLTCIFSDTKWKLCPLWDVSFPTFKGSSFELYGYELIEGE